MGRFAWTGSIITPPGRRTATRGARWCDTAVLAERIAGLGLDTKPTAEPSLAVYDQAFLRGGDLHDAEDEGHVG